MKQTNSLNYLQTQKKVNNNSQQIRSIFIFFISTIVLILFLWSQTNVQNQGVNHINKLLYFTTQSNIIIWFFYFLNLLFIFLNKKYLKIVNSYYIRGSITLYILLTGIIFTFILYPPFILLNLKKTNVTSWNQNNLFSAILINLVLPHILIPTIVFYDFLKFKFKNKPNYIISFFLSFMYPYIYLLFALIIGHHFNNTYPYFFLNFQKLGYLVFFAILASIFVFFIFIWFLLIHRTSKKITKVYNNFTKLIIC